MKLLTGLWKIWFYVLAIVLMLLITPLVIILSYFPKTYKTIYFLMRLGAKCLYYGIGMRYTLHSIQELTDDKYVLISNHTSMMDVMLMLILHPHHPLTFVGKKELVKIPLFGVAYKRICVLVDRHSVRSKARVYELSVEKIKEGRSMVIFPEGGVTEAENECLLPFKDGAFVIAQEAEVGIAAYTFIGMKEAFPFQFWEGGPKRIEVIRERVLNAEEVKNSDSQKIKEEAQQLIFSRLQKNSNNECV